MRQLVFLLIECVGRGRIDFVPGTRKGFIDLATVPVFVLWEDGLFLLPLFCRNDTSCIHKKGMHQSRKLNRS
jgi:hypothetical protein